MAGRNRDKDQMAADVSIVIKSQLSERARYVVLRNVIWDWTLDGLTYKRDCRLVSNGVRELLRASHLAEKAIRKKWSFEHVVPINVLISLLEKAKEFSEHKQLLEQYAIGCLVTKDEESRLRQEKLGQSMPKGWENGNDAFARYKQSGIEVSPRD